MKMIDKDEKTLSISKQAELLSINRTSLYYKPVPVKDEEYKRPDIATICEQV